MALHVGACWGYGVARCVDASSSASMPWKLTRIMYLLPLASSLPPPPPTCSPCKLPPRFRCKTRSIATNRQRPLHIFMHLNCVLILLPPVSSHNQQLESVAEWFVSSNELETPAGFSLPLAPAHALSSSSPAQQPRASAASPSPAAAYRSARASSASVLSPSSATSLLSPMPYCIPHASDAVSPSVFSPSRNHIRCCPARAAALAPLYCVRRCAEITRAVSVAAAAACVTRWLRCRARLYRKC